MLRRMLTAAATLAATLWMTAISAQEAAIKVLILTGEDVPAHDWRATTSVTRRILDKSGRFDVRVCEDIGLLDSKAIHEYDVLVLNFRNNYKRHDISEAARENLLAYVRSGKGLVALHFAVAALQNWDAYPKVIGKTWVPKVSGHGPRGPFKVIVKDRDHPISKGLDDFEIDDELYADLASHAAVHSLVEAYSDKSKKTESLAWTLPYGKGRVLCISLGHDAKARRNPGFAHLLSRGTEWAARGGIAD